MQRLKSIPELIFSKGMNNKDKPEYLEQGQSVLLQNCLVGDEEIRKGPGSVTLFNIGTNKQCLGAIATSEEIYAVFNEPGDSLAFVYRYTGSGNPVVVSSTNLTANTQVNFVDTGTGVYVLNGIDPVGKLVGSVYTRPAGIPIGSFGSWYNGRLYISGNTTYKSRLYYSDANTPDTFGALSYIDIFSKSSSENTGLNSVGGLLIIGKKNNVVTFDGYTTDDFTVKRLAEELPNYGVTSHRSMINTGDDLLFMSFAGDTPHIRSLKRTSFNKLNYGGIISESIEGTMSMVNRNRLEQVAAGFDGRYAWWSLPMETSTINNYIICYDTVKKGWTVHKNHLATVFFRSTILGDDRLFFGTSASTSKIYYFNKEVGTIDGEPIPFKVITRALRPQTSRKSKYKYLYVTTGEDTNTNISVSGSPDGFTSELQENISSLVNSGIFPMEFPFYLGVSTNKKHRINLRAESSYTYQLIFEEESMGTSTVFPLTLPVIFGRDTQVVIKEWDLLYQPRGLRDA